MKKATLALLVLGGLAAHASAADLGGADWNFSYQGQYSLVGLDLSGLGLGVGTLASTTLAGQLALLNGGVAGSGTVSLSQGSASSLTTSALSFQPQGSALLLPAVQSLLYGALSANGGAYSGNLAGSTLTLSKAPVVGAQVDGLAAVDTRVLGTGVVIDLRALLPTNTLVGTVDGFSGGSLAYGPRADHVTGTSSLMDTTALQARATTYVAGFATLSTGYVGLGAIQTTSSSWSLSRPNVQATPEPASLAALGAGALGLIRRRRRA